MLEWLLVLVMFALGAGMIRLPGRAGKASGFAMLVATAVLALASLRARKPEAPAPIASSAAGAFVTSNACRGCHPEQYASWHASYHRTMTQSATIEAAAPPELRRGGRLRLETSGRSVELFADGGRLWARLPDPGVTSAARPEAYAASFAAAPLREVPIELLTGSHHHQAFWTRGARSGELRALPVVYSLDEARLMPRRDAFLNPPDAPERAVRWNSNCVQCHAVAGEPAHDAVRDVFETRAAELGIACEACHGGGAEHARAMRNPLSRLRTRLGGELPSGIVNPAKLGAERGSQVCGRCHSYFFPRDERDWWQHGFAQSFSPGGDLSRAQLLLSPELLGSTDAVELAASTEALFYADGTIRIGGREYNGLVRSACYTRGHAERQLACTSCHSLHRGAPDDQLDPERAGNRACATCHAREAAAGAQHTHHAADSPGSLCYNCHMPHTSYALLGAIRSHRVDSPAFDAKHRDRPNACNLCHLEQSERWAAAQAAAWFGAQPRFAWQARADLPSDDVPAGAVFALSGDAAVRAITGAALGRHQSSDDAVALRTQLLGLLERDEYAAVRAIATRARQSLPPAEANKALPDAIVEALLAARDRRAVTIAE